jgi:hypothetical protein
VSQPRAIHRKCEAVGFSSCGFGSCAAHIVMVSRSNASPQYDDDTLAKVPSRFSCEVFVILFAGRTP